MTRHSAEYLLATERHLQHHLTHEMQNSIGAVTLYLEMVLEDTSDPAVRARLEKAIRANQLTDKLVNSLRHIFPRGDGQTLVLNADMMIHILGNLFGTLGQQIVLSEGIDPRLELGGEPAILFDTLYKAVNFMLGHKPDLQFSIDMAALPEGKSVQIHVRPTPAMDIPGLIHAMAAVPIDGMDFPKEQGGVVLIWPLRPAAV